MICSRCRCPQCECPAFGEVTENPDPQDRVLDLERERNPLLQLDPETGEVSEVGAAADRVREFERALDPVRSWFGEPDHGKGDPPDDVDKLHEVVRMLQEDRDETVHWRRLVKCLVDGLSDGGLTHAIVRAEDVAALRRFWMKGAQAPEERPGRAT